jgi:hypothetical protein
MGVNLKQGYFGTPNIVTDGLVLQLDAVNTKSYVSGSTTWRDLSGRSNSGTLLNAGYRAYNGGAVTFNGSLTSYSTITNDGSLTFGTGDFSIECWFNTNGIVQTGGAAAGLICVDNAGSANNWLLGFNAFGANTMVFFYNASAGISINHNPNVPGWVHIVVARSGGLIRIYINGILNVTGTSLQSNADYSDTSGLKLAQNRAVNDGYNGSISIVRIYSKGLSAGEVAQNYNALKARFGLS